MMRRSFVLGAAVASLVLAGGPSHTLADTTILNVSYDPTREFYQEFNEAFAEHWQQQTGEEVTIQQSHGGAGKQARAVIDGLEADVVTLALAYDIDAIAERSRLVAEGLAVAPAAQQLALHLDHRVPGAQGQPEGHPGLGRPGQGGRPGDHAQPEDLGRRALELPRRLGLGAAPAGRQRSRRRRRSSPISTVTCRSSTPARGARPRPSSSAASATCCWPGRTRPSSRSRSSGRTSSRSSCRRSASWPSRPVTLVDHVVDKHGTREVAEAYLEYLYSPTGQALAAKHYYRPVAPEHADPADLERFPEVELITIDRGVRRLAGGPKPPLRRRRRVRPDRHAIGICQCAPCASSSRASCPGSG